MNARPLDAAARKILLDDAGVEELLAHLRLARGFALFIVPVPTPKIGRALLRLVDEERRVHRGSGATVRALQPHDVLPRTEAPISVNTLAELVLEPLFEGTTNDDRLTWVDATTARPDDDGAWGAVLRMWNERRNSFIALHRAPLVLVIPYRFERLVADAAPDLWSVRNGVFRVRLADLELHLLPLARGAQAANGEGTRALSLVLAALSEAPVQFSAPTRSFVMGQGARELLTSGQIDEAKALTLGAIEHARAAVEGRPDDVDALRALCRALMQDAEVSIYREDGADLPIVREALAVAEQLARKMPRSVEALALVADAALRIATSPSSGPTREQDILCAIETARRWFAYAPEAQSARDALARALLRRAEWLLRRSSTQDAEATFEEVEGLRPHSNAVLADLGLVMSRYALLHNDLPRAITHEEEYIRWLESVESRAPVAIMALRLGARLRIAKLRLRAGDFSAAAAEVAKARELIPEARNGPGFHQYTAKVDYMLQRVACDAYLELGRRDEAQALAAELRPCLARQKAVGLSNAEDRIEVALALAVLADLSDDPEEAVQMRCEAREMLSHVGPLDALTQLDYAEAKHRLDHTPSPPREPSPDRDTLAG